MRDVGTDVVLDLDDVVADRYRLRTLIGRGGMGRVWLARDELLHRDVAIKEAMPPDAATPAEVAAIDLRVTIEAQAAAQVRHPAVVQIHDLLHWHGRPLIVMEYVSSRSLHQIVGIEGPLPPAYLATIGLAVLDGLVCAHRAGVLHRDVTPRNILVSGSGRALLTDFGLATSRQHPAGIGEALTGTAGFIAPERARAGLSSPAGDFWALGATLYTAVEGRSPYARATLAETMAALMSGPIDPPHQAGPLEPALRAMLAHEPEQRPRHYELRRLLLRALTPGAAPAGRRQSRRLRRAGPESGVPAQMPRSVAPTRAAVS
jgi:eukaryotic-like serine/threonine-protein kinase